jgi:lipoprotein LprG
VLTGDFYGTGSTQTYTVTLDDYGTEKDITAP